MVPPIHVVHRDIKLCEGGGYLLGMRVYMRISLWSRLPCLPWLLIANSLLREPLPETHHTPCLLL